MSVDQKEFSLGANNGPQYNNEEANKIGNYNVLHNLYNMREMSW